MPIHPYRTDDIECGEVMNLTNGRTKIALIYGGRGCEHSVSVKSAEYVKSVINREKHYPYPVFIDKGGSWWLDGAEVYPARMGELSGLSDGERIFPIDCAIPILHGDYGEDGRIQGALDTAGIPFVGSDTIAGALCIDKGFTKAVVRETGISTVRGASLPHGVDFDTALEEARKIGFPVFVKPRRLGSSIGAGAARNEDELYRAFHTAAIHGEMLIEELIENKRELEIGILSLGKRRIISPIAEVLCDGFYDFNKKYTENTKTVCPADIPSGIAERIRNFAIRIADATSIRGTARIDFFLSGERVLFNEINTLPGFTKDSLYPTIMRAAGVGESELFDLLIEDAVSR